MAKLERIDTLWNRLQVVAAGKTVQLRSRLGTFSVYRPDRLFTGYSWDCLSAAPGFLASPPERILVLGMGGGTVVRQCRRLYPKARIDAVEIDAQVIRVARRYFHLPRACIRVIHADAMEFIRYASFPYDAILDDVWPDREGEAKPLFWARDYAFQVCRVLRPGGLYAVNLWCRRGRASEMQRAGRTLRVLFPYITILRPPRGPTAVVAAAKEPIAVSRGHRNFLATHSIRLRQL